MPRALDFFAGSGLVRLGLQPEFATIWANDNCPKKRAVYEANHPADTFCSSDIQLVRGGDLPLSELAWASFPCQDLSLAGNLSGLGTGTRSGVFWEWIRVLNELNQAKKLPPIIVAENVVGFLVAHNGRFFRRAYAALRQLGYRVGAVVVDAELFLPQSRPRAFVIGVHKKIDLTGFTQAMPSPPFHPLGLMRTVGEINDNEWIWWSLPTPAARKIWFHDLCEHDAECDDIRKTEALCAMLSPANRLKLDKAIRSDKFLVGTAYKRTRPNESGQKTQRLELRFDGIAGCLRTPEGGSSRQLVILVNRGRVQSRLITVRECARLMGAPDTYILPGSYNDGYRAMGDAVAVPVTRWITSHLLAPLAERCHSGYVKTNNGSVAQKSESVA